MSIFRSRARSDMPPMPTVEDYERQFDEEMSWAKEWEALRATKTAEVALPEAPYSVWRKPDGWWVVGKFTVKTIPDEYQHPLRYSPFHDPIKPMMYVTAFGQYEPMAPNFYSEEAAVEWLHALLANPAPKERFFAPDGSEVFPKGGDQPSPPTAPNEAQRPNNPYNSTNTTEG